MTAKKWLTLCRCGALVLAMCGPLAVTGRVVAEPSLANVLGRQQAAVDPTAQCARQLADIERRPFAHVPAVQRALVEARAELSKARSAYLAGASERELRRSIVVVRAALSAADRLQARAFARAALARLKAQADSAEAAAQLAQSDYQQASAALAAAREPKP